MKITILISLDKLTYTGNLENLMELENKELLIKQKKFRINYGKRIKRKKCVFSYEC